MSGVVAAQWPPLASAVLPLHDPAPALARSELRVRSAAALSFIRQYSCIIRPEIFSLRPCSPPTGAISGCSLVRRGHFEGLHAHELGAWQVAAAVDST